MVAVLAILVQHFGLVLAPPFFRNSMTFITHSIQEWEHMNRMSYQLLPGFHQLF